MTHSLDDLTRTTTYHRAAAQTYAAKSSDFEGFEHYMIMNAYAEVLRIRYEVLREEESAIEGLALRKQLVKHLPNIQVDRASILCGLVKALMSGSPGREEAAEALGHLLDALANNTCPAYRRLTDVSDALTYVVERSAHLNRENAATLSGVYSTAISLLPHVASFGLDPRARLEVISSSSRLTAQGATHAISIGQHELAIEMLETGRSVFWAQCLRLRTPFTGLPPEVADRLTKLASALGQPVPDFARQGPARDREQTRRRQLSDEFVSAVNEARRLPGFDDLLQNASYTSLARAAQQHPVVVLVAGEGFGRAMIILEDAQCIPVTLEMATDATLRALSHRIETHSRQVRSRGVKKVYATEGRSGDVYRELWTLVMAPIIDALGWPASPDLARLLVF
jgi:hypothetical protein